jgi:hypothetical protein
MSDFGGMADNERGREGGVLKQGVTNGVLIVTEFLMVYYLFSGMYVNRLLRWNLRSMEPDGITEIAQKGDHRI